MTSKIPKHFYDYEINATDLHNSAVSPRSPSDSEISLWSYQEECLCKPPISYLRSGKLEGSCQCGAVEFTLQSHTPVPYQLCACSICRKCGGYSGSINLGGVAKSLKAIKGNDKIKKYNAIKDRGKPEEEKCSSERNFCSNCSSMLWLWDHHWPELIHPFASAIDTPLPTPDTIVCVRGDSKPDWVRWPEGKKEVYEEFGGLSIEEWHKKHGQYVE